MNKTDLISFIWAKAEQLEEVCNLGANFDSQWGHPKIFFEESLQCQRLLLASDGETPIAYLLYQIIWGNTAFLSLLNVLPAYQRKGIGTSMVKLLEVRLADLGFKSYVTSSETTNSNTKRFFPDLGFAQIGELNMHHGGEIFYLKKLA